MIWWTIFFIVTGLFIGICPVVISENVRKCSSEYISESKRAESKVNHWLLASFWAILLVSAGFSIEVNLACEAKLEKEIGELREQLDETNRKFELLGINPAKDTLFIREYLEDK